MEFAGIVKHVQQTQPAKVAVDWSRSATLGAHEVLLAANGVGWKRAGAAVDAAADFRPDAVVSTGFCGALEDLNIADIVVGTSILREAEDSFLFRKSLPLPFLNRDREGAIRTGPVLSLDHVAQTAEEKCRLRSSGAFVVEMEAAGVSDRCHAMGLPFHCVKAVTDLAGETLANDFNSALRSDGHFDTMLILRRSFRYPTARLPELIRLRNRCVRAAHVLGEFFADCRF
jgi:adenosylhomocysteine nucleosidase